MVRCSPAAASRMERSLVSGNGFFKNGEPRGIGGFDDKEQKHDVWKRYHANGQLWDEGRFEHGKKKRDLGSL